MPTRLWGPAAHWSSDGLLAAPPFGQPLAGCLALLGWHLRCGEQDYVIDQAAVLNGGGRIGAQARRQAAITESDVKPSQSRALRARHTLLLLR